jgi:hypothetical protein
MIMDYKCIIIDLKIQIKYKNINILTLCQLIVANSAKQHEALVC